MLRWAATDNGMAMVSEGIRCIVNDAPHGCSTSDSFQPSERLPLLECANDERERVLKIGRLRFGDVANAPAKVGGAGFLAPEGSHAGSGWGEGDVGGAGVTAWGAAKGCVVGLQPESTVRAGGQCPSPNASKLS